MAVTLNPIQFCLLMLNKYSYFLNVENLIHMSSKHNGDRWLLKAVLGIASGMQNEC
ncbi:hypothetical protein Hanom_Chr08g00754001 [Helianthus anomalus]